MSQRSEAKRLAQEAVDLIDAMIIRRDDGSLILYSVEAYLKAVAPANMVTIIDAFRQMTDSESRYSSKGAAASEMSSAPILDRVAEVFDTDPCHVTIQIDENLSVDDE